MPKISMSEVYARLASSGQEHLVDDVYAKLSLDEALSNGDVQDDAFDTLSDLSNNYDPSSGVSFVSGIQEAMKNLIPQDSSSAIDTLKASTSQGFDLSPLLKSKSAEPFFGELKAEDDGNYIWNSLERGATNDLGFMQATSGLVADAVGADQLGEWLKTKAQANFESADAIEHSESTLGWAGELILEQVPSMVLTLGTGWAIKTGAKMAFGNAAKATVKKGLMDAAIKKGLSKELAEKTITDSVVDSVAKVGLRDAFTNKGRQAFEAGALKKLKGLGIEISEDAAKDAVNSGLKRRLLAETIAPMVGMTAASYGMTTGDIIRDLQQEAEKLGVEGPTFGDVAVGGLAASAFDMIPAASFAKKFGFLGEGGGIISKVIGDGANSGMLKKITKEIAKGSATEGTTEAMQAMVSEATKKVFIDKWPSMTEDQKMSVGQYLFRPEAWERYGQEFLGGAVVGGVFGGVGGAFESSREGKAQAEIDAAKGATSDAKSSAEQKAKEQAWVEKNMEILDATMLSLPAAGQTTQMEQKEFLSPTAAREKANRTEPILTENENTEAKFKALDVELKEINDLVASGELTKEEAEAGYEDIRVRRKAVFDEQPVDSLVAQVKKANAMKTNNKAVKLAKLKPIVEKLRSMGFNPDGTQISAVGERPLSTPVAEPTQQKTQDQPVSEEPDNVDINMETPLPGQETAEKVDEFVDEQEVDDQVAQGQNTVEETTQEVGTPAPQEVQDNLEQDATQSLEQELAQEFAAIDEHGGLKPIVQETERHEKARDLFGLAAIRESGQKLTTEQKQSLKDYDDNYFEGELFSGAVKIGRNPIEAILNQVGDDAEIQAKADRLAGTLQVKGKARGSSVAKSKQDTPLTEAENLKAEDLVAKKYKEPGEKFDTTTPAPEGFVNYEGNTIPEKLGEKLPEGSRTAAVDTVLAKRQELEQAIQKDGDAVIGTQEHERLLDLRDEYTSLLDIYAKSLGITGAMAQVQADKGTRDSSSIEGIRTIRSAAIAHAINTDRTRAEAVIGTALVNKIMSKGGPQYSKPNPDNGGRMGMENILGWLDAQKPGFLSGTDIVVTDTASFSKETGSQSTDVWDGAYHDSKIYLNADTLTDSNIEKVLFHESLGHAMAKKALGPAQYAQMMNTIMRQITALNSSGKDVKIGDQYLSDVIGRYKNLKNEDGSWNSDITEEVWAAYIEAHTEGKLNDRSSVFMRVYDAIRAMVRKALGLETNANDVNAQAAKLVRKARMNSLELNEDVSAQPRSEPQYSKPDMAAKNKIQERDLADSVRVLGITLPKFMNNSFLADFGYSPRKKDDIGLIKRFLFMPQWLAEQGSLKSAPAAQQLLYKMFQKMTQISDRTSELNGRYINQSGSFFNANQIDKTAVEKALIQGDKDGISYKTAQEAGMNPQQFTIYQDVRKTLDGIRDQMVVDANMAITKLEQSAQAITEEGPKALMDARIRDLKNSAKALQEVKGYFPRVRPNAELSISYIDKNGRKHVEPIDGKGARADVQLRRRKAEVEAEGATDVSLEEHKVNPYDSMDKVDPSQVTNLISSLMLDKDGKLPEGLPDLLKNVFYAQGFGKHYIHRMKMKDKEGRGDVTPDAPEGTTIDAETGVIHGYQTEGLDDVLLGYITNFSRHSARADSSREMGDMFETQDENGKPIFDPQDPRKQGVFKTAEQFLKTAHKGMDGYDKTVKKANAMAYHLWIGGRVSSAMWNMTHIHMFGSSLIHNELKKQGKASNLFKLSGDVMGAHKDSVNFMVKAKGKKVGEKVTMGEMGWSTPQQQKDLAALNEYYEITKVQTMTSQTYEEVLQSDANMFKRGLNKYKKAAGSMMHYTEVSNRLASMLSHYRAFDQKDLESSKMFVRKLNGSYEAFNLPGWLQGKGFLKGLGQSTLYTFGTHVQNTSQILWELGSNDKAAFAYGLAAASILGGVPGKETAEALGQMMFGESMDLWLRETYGDSIAKATQAGLIFPLADIDAGRSLALSPPPIMNAVSQIMGKGDEHALMSPISGMIKAAKGEAAWHKMIPFKGVQSIAQAIGEGEEIQIGRNKVLTDDGKPMQLTGWEQMLTLGGFQPTRKSQASREIWNSSQVRRWWNDSKSKVVSAMRNATTPMERAEARKMMAEYNSDLREIRKHREYREIVKNKPITWADARRERGTKTVRTI